MLGTNRTRALSPADRIMRCCARGVTRKAGPDRARSDMLVRSETPSGESMHAITKLGIELGVCSRSRGAKPYG
jgi:hypothetical protein